MPRALLIYGAAPHQMNQVKEFNKFLKHNLVDTAVLPAGYLTDEELKSDIGAFLDGNPDEPAMIYYSGHGNKGIWGFNEDYQLNYFCLARIIKKYQDKFPILVVNDSCASGSMFDIFRVEGINPKKVGLIAATQAKNYAYGGNFLKTLLKEWGTKKHHSPQQLERRGIMGMEREMILLTIDCVSKVKSGVLGDMRLKYMMPWLKLKHQLIELRDKVFDRVIVRLQSWQGKDTSWLLKKEQISQRWGVELDHHFFKNGKPPMMLTYAGKDIIFTAE